MYKLNYTASGKKWVHIDNVWNGAAMVVDTILECVCERTHAARQMCVKHQCTLFAFVTSAFNCAGVVMKALLRRSPAFMTHTPHSMRTFDAVCIPVGQPLKSNRYPRDRTHNRLAIDSLMAVVASPPPSHRTRNENGYLIGQPNVPKHIITSGAHQHQQY